MISFMYKYRFFVICPFLCSYQNFLKFSDWNLKENDEKFWKWLWAIWKWLWSLELSGIQFTKRMNCIHKLWENGNGLGNWTKIDKVLNKVRLLGPNLICYFFILLAFCSGVIVEYGIFSSLMKIRGIRW